jgi:hypothetical protein
MRQSKDSRDGDPVCYGDTNVVLEVQSSKNETRYLGRLSNYRKNNSKTDGGYLISGHGQHKQQKRSTNKHILFRIDGDAIWSGVSSCMIVPRLLTSFYQFVRVQVETD